MMEMYNGTMASIDEGEIVKAHVLEIRDNLVVLDIGFKSEGSVPLEEFKDFPDLKIGDEVEVLLEHLEDQEGSVVLSKKKADFMRVWERIRLAYENDQPVEGTLVKKIKGGVVVDLMGVDAFLPGSQIALRRVPNIDELLGQKFEFKIIKLNKRRRNIVVSRRVILENERAGKREKLMKELEKDQIRKGVVKNITDFGAFIDLGGVDGLLHITDMSWGRISHPSELVQIGSELEVKVLDIDWQRERISLGLKQLQSYPWKDVAEKYPVGTRVQGKVVSITNYGAFIELEPGIEGSGAHQRDELDAQRAAPVEARQHRRDDRGGGAQGRSERGEDLARHEADGAGSVGRAAAQVPGRHAHQRQGEKPHELRRVRRNRAGN
jgi:small subunit ribosomal protein S1